MRKISLLFFCVGLTCVGLAQNISVHSPQLVSIRAINLPRVIILATGGTIAGQGTSATSAGYTPGKLPIEDLLKNIPSINKIANVRGEQIASVGSYDMTIAIWLKLAKRINEIFDKDEADGIVITHGTDTQEETAYFLSLTVSRKKPVVITGSMRPATAISTDGPKNLYDAILVACDSQSINRGVILSFNETLFEGKNAVKINITNVNAFDAPNTGAIGQVYDGRVHYYHATGDNITTNALFDISKLETLPKVEIAYMYADASASAIEAFLNSKVDGLIIAGTGNGSFNKAFIKAVGTAVNNGVIVVRSSRVGSGRVTQFNQVFDDKKLGTIAGDDLNPQKARILLMLALTITRDKDRIQQMFLAY